LDMTATTAMPDAVLTGFALNLKRALLISTCLLTIETAIAAQQCCCSHDKTAIKPDIFWNTLVMYRCNSPGNGEKPLTGVARLPCAPQALQQ